MKFYPSLSSLPSFFYHLSLSLSLPLFLLALHFLGFAEVWDYDLEWDRLPDLSQGYTRIAAIVPSHRSHCLGIDEWICICLAQELNFSLFRLRESRLSRSVSPLPAIFGARSANHPASSNLDAETPKTIPIVSRMYRNSASVKAARRFKALMD